ncbi:MAG: hypothetical protein WC413_00830 [Candidatus Nanoarchaeia archaeon]
MAFKNVLKWLGIGLLENAILGVITASAIAGLGYVKGYPLVNSAISSLNQQIVKTEKSLVNLDIDPKNYDLSKYKRIGFNSYCLQHPVTCVEDYFEGKALLSKIKENAIKENNFNQNVKKQKAIEAEVARIEALKQQKEAERQKRIKNCEYKIDLLEQKVLGMTTEEEVQMYLSDKIPYCDDLSDEDNMLIRKQFDQIYNNASKRINGKPYSTN